MISRSIVWCGHALLAMVCLGGAAATAKPTPAASSPAASSLDLFIDEVRPQHPGHGEDQQPPYAGPGYSVGTGGMPPISFPASGVRLLSWIPVTTFDPSFTSGNSCWGYVSPSGREYAIMGLSGGTAFVEVTDPGNPVIVSVRPGPVSVWRDMKTYQRYAYSVSEGGGGIQVFNLSDIDSGVVTLVRSVTTGGGTATHTVHVNEQTGYLYRCGGQGGTTYGLRIYNLNPDPSNPAFVAQWNVRYAHETQVVVWNQGPFAGREVAFVYGNDTSGGGNPRINILDVTNKASITQISAASWPNSAFSHQGWITPDQRYLYLDDELDESTFNIYSRTRIFDVSNLAAPTLVGTFSTGRNNIDHNQYVKGNLLFQADYRAGLQVFDISNPVSPVLIGYFDTYPDDDNPHFNGLWNNYPFFPSGTIIGSDIEKGLFVWRLGEPELSVQFEGGAPALIPAQGGRVFVRITPAQGQGVMPGSAKFRYTIGGGELAVDLLPVDGDLYRADLPDFVCGQSMRFYATAKSTSGLTTREPPTAPTGAYSATVASTAAVGFDDTMETHLGWSVGFAGDTATTGLWVRADPVGTAAQPEDDATPNPGTICWITGNGTPGGSVGEADVDGGATTLVSPRLDATAFPGEALIRYARWYSNDQGGDPNNDSMPVYISNNDGATWILLELVAENAHAWVRKSFRIADVISPTSQMRLRFVARDDGAGSIVEAGVDDVRIMYVECAPPPPVCAGDADGDGTVDFADITSVLTNWGAVYWPATGPGDADGDGTVDFADITSVLAGFGAPCA